ncbi:YdcF family protein [Ochrobactrum sp. Q0168]|uniref:YdcF family protein n=1 Tax=Ochrobactrum sp. Q0168 TaxID=2793241 RepID=UPI0018EC0373|nr:YdcF family protein [Ochrobactrum sp. Q0168]
MTLNIIVGFIAVGLLLWYFKCRKLGAVSIALGIVLYSAIASAILPDDLMNRLQSPYSSTLQSPLEDNTAFIIFGMGTQTVMERGQKVVEPLAFSYGPLFAAASMNHRCIESALKCTFIVSGADVAGTGVSEAASIAEQLVKVGIDPDSILLEEKSRNTWQNAKNTAAILRAIKPAKVVLLQAAPIIQRDLLYLAHFGVKPEPVAAGFLTVAHTNMSSAGLYFLITDLALHEAVGIWRYDFYNYMGWNEPKQPPLALESAVPTTNLAPAR